MKIVAEIANFSWECEHGLTLGQSDESHQLLHQLSAIKMLECQIKCWPVEMIKNKILPPSLEVHTKTMHLFFVPVEKQPCWFSLYAKFNDQNCNVLLSVSEVTIDKKVHPSLLLPQQHIPCVMS